MIEHANSLLALAVIILAGLLAGVLARRVRLPEIIGQIVVGVLLGRSVFNVFGPETVERLHIVTQFALGVIALTVGEHLNIRRLRNAGRRLFLLLLTESVITPLLVVAAAFMMVRSPWLPLLLGTMAVSTAPATVIALIKESRSRGVFVKTLTAAVAFNNIACVVLFVVAKTVAVVGISHGEGFKLFSTVVLPEIRIFESILLGFGCGTALVVLTRHEVRSGRLAAASVLALFLVCGLSLYLGISLLLSCLFLGIALANLTPKRKEIGGSVFENLLPVVFAIFFTLAGMDLEFENIAEAGLLAGIVIATRFSGKLLAANLAMRMAGATPNVRRYLGFALIPQAGVAVGLILLVEGDPALAPLHRLLLEVGLTSVMANELLGSLTAGFALKKSGDAGKDRPRLMDFIEEEHIVTGLESGTKEEAIIRLADLTIRTHHLKIDRQSFIRSILEREKEASTCVGAGLAIPHGILEEGSSMVGVMGLSRKGMHFETPDGRPVHCMVLLATPESDRERHLQVMGSLVRSIGRDPVLQEQLFNAETPAHAHDILHAEEAEGFNYYLSD
jgi:PTS system fructose-specific IIC component